MGRLTAGIFIRVKGNCKCRDCTSAELQRCFFCGDSLSSSRRYVCCIYTKDSDYLFRWLHVVDLVVLATGLVNKLATWVSLYIQKPWL